jgi:hypothetical protein
MAPRIAVRMNHRTRRAVERPKSLTVGPLNLDEIRLVREYGFFAKLIHLLKMVVDCRSGAGHSTSVPAGARQGALVRWAFGHRPASVWLGVVPDRKILEVPDLTLTEQSTVPSGRS